MSHFTKRPNRAIAIWLFIFLLIGPSPALVRRAQEIRPKPIVLLISLDGFRWDYLDRYPAPNLSALAAQGVRAKGLIPAFPSDTFPNHYTIVTGVYPETHGIIANGFYDPAFKETFSMRPTESKWWGAVPIWITEDKQVQGSATPIRPGPDVGLHV